MPSFVSIGSVCILKCSAEAPVSPEFGIDEPVFKTHRFLCMWIPVKLTSSHSSQFCSSLAAKGS